MRVVTFKSDSDYFESFSDFKLILTSREVQSPSVKTKYVNIEGSNGSLDLTEVFGKTFYKDRTIKLVFSLIEDEIPFWERFSKIQNKLHGKFFDISFSDDDLWYYQGRVSLDKWSSSKVYGKITMTITSRPYKLCKELTKKSFSINGTTSIVLWNNHSMEVVPTFISSSNMHIVGANGTLNTSEGVECKSNSITLKEGDNLLTVTGTGELKIIYQEGSL